MKKFIICVVALGVSATLFYYASNRNFMENVNVMATELDSYTLVEDPIDLIETDSDLAWIYMEGVVLSDSDVITVPKEQEVKTDSKPVSKSYECLGYEEFYAVNSETVGYIHIENSKVDYPILYHEDNNYYLDYNVYGEKDSNGAIYLDAFSGGEWGRINLVHGHSMRNGTMFRDILNYVKQDWYEEHKQIKVFDGSVDKVYEVFSVYILDAAKEAVPLYYDSEEEFLAWLKDVEDRSVVSGSDVITNTDLLVLNTCSYQFDGAHTIIVASRVQ